MSIYSKIYGKNKTEPTPTLKNDNKSATRVLAGMKVQNSHMKRLNIDGEEFDIPKMEYVHLLDKQLKDVREENRNLQNKITRIENACNKIYNDLRDLKANSVQKPKFKKFKMD